MNIREIESPGPGDVVVDDIDPGELFFYDDTLFMKMLGGGNSFDLHHHHTSTFCHPNETKVTPVHGELTWWRK